MKRLCFTLVATALLSVSRAEELPQLEVRLSPGPVDAVSGRGVVAVALRIAQADAADGTAVLTLPVVIDNTDTVATTLQDLSVTDAQGTLPLIVKDDSDGVDTIRHWIAGRAVKGELVVRYRAPIDNTPPARGTGSPYQLRIDGGGISGVGNTFILLPETKTHYRIAVRWDLHALGSGATATSSFGDGDVELPAGPAEQLHSAIFMAGHLHRHPMPVKENGFAAAWLGDPPFDPRKLMGWADQLHEWMRGFFQDASAAPYRVILRYNPINAGGGVALTRSFLLTWGETAKDPEALKSTLSHEMIHTWTGGSDGWYSEGVAVYYQSLLPLRAGLITPQAFLDDVNTTARRYYLNTLNNTPDEELDARFWEDTRIRVLPYDRGALYFAVLNGRIQRASRGQRSVDDLVLEMIRREREGQPATEKVWLELIGRELGEAGRRFHADMKRGVLMLPEPADFGPCFTRTTGRFRRFELGFDPKSLVGVPKTIRGLLPGSEAEKAGLRNGDVVTYSVALDGVQEDPDATLTLQVTRGGKRFPITYLPRGEWATAWQWMRVADVPDNRCTRGAAPFRQ